MMGARDGPMWASWLLSLLVVNVFVALEFVGCLYLFDFDFLTRHDARLTLLLVLLTYVANVACACFFSSVFHHLLPRVVAKLWA